MRCRASCRFPWCARTWWLVSHFLSDNPPFFFLNRYNDKLSKLVDIIFASIKAFDAAADNFEGIKVGPKGGEALLPAALLVLQPCLAHTFAARTSWRLPCSKKTCAC